MKKDSKYVTQLFIPPMEGGRFVNAPVAVSTGETNFFRLKPARKLHREQCFECEGTGKITIYPLFDVPCHECKGRGYTLELHISFGMS